MDLIIESESGVRSIGIDRFENGGGIWLGYKNSKRNVPFDKLEKLANGEAEINDISDRQEGVETVKDNQFEPPTCPNCEKPLKKVGESIYEIYKFNSKTGTYEEDHPALGMDIYCENCGEKIDSDIFPEGACNYKQKRRGD